MLFVFRCASRSWLFRPSVCLSVCQGFAICYKMWQYRRNFVAANLPKQFKSKK